MIENTISNTKLSLLTLLRLSIDDTLKSIYSSIISHIKKLYQSPQSSLTINLVNQLFRLITHFNDIITTMNIKYNNTPAIIGILSEAFPINESFSIPSASNLDVTGFTSLIHVPKTSTEILSSRTLFAFARAKKPKKTFTWGGYSRLIKPM